MHLLKNLIQIKYSYGTKFARSTVKNISIYFILVIVKFNSKLVSFVRYNVYLLTHMECTIGWLGTVVAVLNTKVYITLTLLKNCGKYLVSHI